MEQGDPIESHSSALSTPPAPDATAAANLLRLVNFQEATILLLAEEGADALKDAAEVKEMTELDRQVRWALGAYSIAGAGAEPGEGQQPDEKAATAAAARAALDHTIESGASSSSGSSVEIGSIALQAGKEGEPGAKSAVAASAEMAVQPPASPPPSAGQQQHRTAGEGLGAPRHRARIPHPPSSLGTGGAAPAAPASAAATAGEQLQALSMDEQTRHLHARADFLEGLMRFRSRR